MKVTIYDNYHAGVAMLSREEQDAFYGAIMRYAFDGEEPEFDGISAAVWATIQTFIDKSIEGQNNGAKGGNGRGNRKDARKPSRKATAKTDCETNAENPSENPSEKPTGKTVCEKQINEMEWNGKENHQDFFSNSNGGSVGADADRSAPPSPQGDSKVPVCPLCSKPVRFDAGEMSWRCGMCGPIKEPEFREVPA